MINSTYHDIYIVLSFDFLSGVLPDVYFRYLFCAVLLETISAGYGLILIYRNSSAIIGDVLLVGTGEEN